MSEHKFLEVGNDEHRRRIAYITQPPPAPGAVGLIWLLGLKSDMVSTKATALADWAPANGFGLTRYEYSGHGSSSGAFEEATIGDWLEESRAVLEELTTGPQILVGSSTGGHIALVMLRDLIRDNPQLASRIKGAVLIAPAWDLTEELMWKRFPEEGRRALIEDGVYNMPSDYGDPYPISRRFIEEGRAHLLARETFEPGCPVVILQGLQDEAVPAAHVRELVSFMNGDDVELIEVPDGEHRMSRPQDLELLYAAIRKVAGSGKS